jgi:NitT/TauT family transport system substrate-binding protein
MKNRISLGIGKRSKSMLVSGLIGLMVLFVMTGQIGAQGMQKVKIGYLVADQLHQYSLPIGLEKGYFAEEGLEVVPLQYAAAGIMMQHFAANEMDIGIPGVSGAMIAKAGGTDVVIVGSNNHGGSSLVVDPTISKFEDLKGQPVGNPGIGSNHHTLLTMLEKKFNTPVKKQTIKPTDMTIFAKNKEVKGIICYEPHPTRVMKEAGFKRLFTSNQILEDQQCCVLITSQKYIKEHRDIVYKILKVNAKATKYVRDHKESALKIIAKYSGIEEDVLRDAYPNMIYPWPPYVSGETSKILLKGLMDAEKVDTAAIKPNMDAWWDALYDKSFEKKLMTDGYIAKLEKEGVKK